MTDEISPDQLQALIKESILDLLKLAPPSKPIDPTAPFPHWVKRTIQREWIKAERERRAAKDSR